MNIPPEEIILFWRPLLVSLYTQSSHFVCICIIYNYVQCVLEKRKPGLSFIFFPVEPNNSWNIKNASWICIHSHWDIWWKKQKKGDIKEMLMNHPFLRQGRCILTNLAHLFCAIWFWHLNFKLFLLIYAWPFRIVWGVKRKKKNWTLW